MKLRFVLILVVLFLAACAQGAGEIKPPEIRVGETVCADCNMIISDLKFAAGYVHEISPGRYESKVFDDIGDMLNHAGKHPDHKVAAWYVHDYTSQEWIDATKASYVHSRNLQTPMASGVAAHATVASAQAQAGTTDGEVLDWAGLQALFNSGALNMGGHGGMTMHE